MADFCNQCASDNFNLPGDLDGITSPEEWAQGRAVLVICEGCGIIQVDPAGNCVSEGCLEKHGDGVVWPKPSSR